jgi:hypothetical protein
MAQDFFILNSAGDFATPANWTSGVPTSTEDAEIDSAGGFAVSTASETVNSIGTDNGDGLLIGGGVFVVADGTGPEENEGSISVVDASLAMEDGTFVNPGVLSLAGYNSSNVGTLLITDSVELAGSGQVAMTIGGGPSANTIEGFSFVEVPTLTNDNDTVSGDGTILGLNFINTAGGLIETNNSSSTSGGDMQIEGSAGGGSFTNDGFMEINNGGEFVFGVSGDTTIDNDGSIIFQGANKLTRLAVIGVVTISAAGDGGRIELGGSTPADDSIITTGLDAALVLDKQTLDGAGTIDDPELSLDLLSGEIIADVPNQELFVAPATLTNDDTLAAIDGGELVLNGPVENKGIISVSGAGSIVDIFHRGSVAGPGIFKIGTGGSLQVVGSASGLFGFVGPDATILLGPAGVLQGTINGMEASDAIDVTGVAFLRSIQAVWQQNGATGTLSLVNNGSTLAMFTLSGQYTAADFEASGDGEGGTSIQMLNPGPPAGTTADMITRDDGDYEIYDIGGNAILAAHALGEVAPQWQVAGLGSFNGSDTSDMLLRDSVDGSLQVEDIGNNNITNSTAMGQVGLEWAVAGFGDFSSRAGETDMVMRNSNSGTFEVYDISNNQITSAAPMGQVGLEWSVAGFGDFSTQSNETDMLMRNVNSGAFEFYDISNNQITSAGPMGQVGLEWSIAGFGHFSGNANETDMLMRNSNTGVLEVYDIRGNTITSAAAMGQVGLEWQVVGFGPISGAGASDMVMRNSNDGAFELFDISNNQITAAAPMGQVGLEWSVAGIAADPPSEPAATSAQLLQAMASFASSAGAPDSSAPLGQPAVQPNVSGLFAVTAPTSLAA